MSDLQLILIVLGVILIIGVLAHGLWVSRKNAKPQAHWGENDIDTPPPSINLTSQEPHQDKVEPSFDAHGFDEYGVSQPRVIENEHVQPSSATSAHEVNDLDTLTTANSSASHLDSHKHFATGDMGSHPNSAGNNSDPALDEIPSLQDAEFVQAPTAETSPETEESGPLYAPAVSNPKPASHYQTKRHEDVLKANDGVDLPPPPPSYLQTESTSDTNDADDNINNDAAPGFQSNDLGMPVSQSTSDEVGDGIHSTKASTTATRKASATASVKPSESPASSVVTPSEFESDKPLDSTPKASEPVKQSLTDAAMGLFSRGKSKNRRTQKRTEPKVNENQFNMDFDSVDPVLNEAKAESQLRQQEAQPGTKKVAQPIVNNNIEPEFLSISVKATDENPITGARLLPLLLTLGLKYGDKDIFHRHVNINGKGPVLFSLANMYKPGTFDIENMETLNTKGVTLFMSLPTESDAHQVFNMMHNAARKLADEFDAQVWDDSRSILTMQGLQQYVERIRNFEKRRLLG